MADVAPVLFKKRVVKSSAPKKRAATPPAEQSSGSDYSSEDEGGVRVKRRRTGGIRAAAARSKPAEELSKSIAFIGDRSAAMSNQDDATRTSNWFDADAADPSKRATQRDPQEMTAAPGGAYKGTSKYSDFIKKNPEAPTRSLGPMKGPTNVRTLTITDFAPDVCKDYKQTGFCGFGDSCKFLHAREDYKQGWQIDKEWEKAQKDGGGGATANKLVEEDPSTKDIPFACIICTKPYRTPAVVTKCGHYFCEVCAMTRYRSKNGKTCAACKADTGGNFSIAKNLNKLLERKRLRLQEQRDKDRAAGMDVVDDEA